MYQTSLKGKVKIPDEVHAIAKPICDWCGNKVRSRWATYILPDGSIKHTHGKERWFPEVYRLFKIHDLPHTTIKGPHGEILDFREEATKRDRWDNI